MIMREITAGIHSGGGGKITTPTISQTREGKTLLQETTRPMKKTALISRLLILLPLIAASVVAQPVVDLKPVVITEAVEHDADDPAVWVNRTHPAESLIIGTDKGRDTGALYVFGLDGKIRQKISGLGRPNNVDVEYGFQFDNQRIDIAVLTETNARRLRIFRISSAGQLTDISADRTALFAGEPQNQTMPMGIALYKRPKDGAVYAIVSRLSGPKEGYLGQYLLRDNGSGKVEAAEIRKFGRFNGADSIEAVAIDDALGYVYYADEPTCIRKYPADPDHPSAGEELAVFGGGEYAADREGLGLYILADGTGYVVGTDQLGNSKYLIYPREGLPGKPHAHGKAIKVIQGGASHTDGIEVESTPLGPRFPNGILVAMNSSGRNFFIYDWRAIAETGNPKLKTNR